MSLLCRRQEIVSGTRGEGAALIVTDEIGLDWHLAELTHCVSLCTFWTGCLFFFSSRHQ